MRQLVLILPALMAGAGALSPAQPQATRSVVVNAVKLSDAQVTALEQRFKVKVHDGDYWYDKMTGAWGMKGSPTLGWIQAGQDLGGALRADASGGGNGSLTGVFVNGRELHPVDVIGLQRITPVYQGRYWVDAMGNVGYEGGPAIANLWYLARQRGMQGNGQWSAYSKDGSLFLGQSSDGCYYFNDASTSTSWSSDKPGC